MSERKIFSMADIGQFEEEQIEGYNGAADANASMPPLPHDVYMFRVAYAEKWPDGTPLAAAAALVLPHVAGDAYPDARWVKRASKDGKLFYMTFITWTSAENKDAGNDGRSRTEVLMTYPNKRGTTGAQALLQGFDIDTIMLNSHSAQAVSLDEPLTAGTLVGMETDWEGRLFDKDAIRVDEKTGEPILLADGSQAKGVELMTIRGMKNFPKNEDGTFRPEITVSDTQYRLKNGDPLPTDLLPLRAFNFQKRWVPKSKMAPVEQMETTAEILADPASKQEPVVAAVVAAKPPAPPVVAAAVAAPRPPAAPPARPPVRRVGG